MAMHTHSLDRWRHGHVFLGERHARNERRTWAVVALTAATMVAEIVGGTVFGSMALIADGWHMATHTGALALAALAYRFARRHADDPRFSFGTGKLGELAGFSGALILGVVAVLIGYESLVRLLNPVAIGFDQAIAIAALGLAVNLASAWLLRDDHAGYAPPSEGDRPQGRDHNLRAAYLHVLADALTSVLAIVALLAGRVYGWVWMDPLMGMVGAGLIALWSWGLVRASGAVLLDAVPDPELARQVRRRLEVGGDRIADLHLWLVGPGHTAAIVSIVSDAPQPPTAYKAKLDGLKGLSHVTVEVHACRHAPAVA
jgi:cation diffusion facilitator family transporter